MLARCASDADNVRACVSPDYPLHFLFSRIQYRANGVELCLHLGKLLCAGLHVCSTRLFQCLWACKHVHTHIHVCKHLRTLVCAYCVVIAQSVLCHENGHARVHASVVSVPHVVFSYILVLCICTKCVYVHKHGDIRYTRVHVYGAAPGQFARATSHGPCTFTCASMSHAKHFIKAIRATCQQPATEAKSSKTSMRACVCVCMCVLIHVTHAQQGSVR
jgi:hypothetical protein